MDTILRKIILNNDEVYYCIVSHNLETFKYIFKNEIELINDDEYCNNSTFTTTSFISVPSYIRTMEVDDVTKSVLSSKFKIKDTNNLFSKFYKRFTYIELESFISSKSYGEFHYDIKSFYLVVNNEVINIFNPSKYWYREKDRKKLLYKDNGLVSKLLLENPDEFILVNNINDYSYPIFHTVTIDMFIYIEYTVLRIMILNTIFRQFKNSLNKDMLLIDNPIDRMKYNEAPGIEISKLCDYYGNAHSKIEFNKLFDNYCNRNLSMCYKSIIESIKFIDDCTFDYDSFVKVYKESVNEYFFSALMLMRLDFIKSMVGVPVGFKPETLAINTPVGVLNIIGGDFTWELCKIS